MLTRIRVLTDCHVVVGILRLGMVLVTAETADK